MGLIAQLQSLFLGLSDFFSMFRSIFNAFPLPVKLVIYFGFGGVLLIMLVQMLRGR